MERAYSILTRTAVDEERRVIRGMATTPAPDRHGDIVEPSGAVFRNPTPLLWQHKHDAPVGSVTFSRATEAGIPFVATLPSIKESGSLQARVDEAWQSIREKLVTAVSIGFIPDPDYTESRPGGGWRFNRYEIIELSLVTVPANADAIFEAVKSMDADNRERKATQRTVSPREQRRLERMKRRGGI